MYALDNGELPQASNNIAKNLLLDGGYLKAWPSPVTSTGVWQGGSPDDYHYHSSYDDMDGGTTADSVIWVGYFTDELCDVFMAKYANDLGTLRSAQFDWAGNGNAYPGEILGKGARVYGIKWASADVDWCEIEWVMEYKD